MKQITFVACSSIEGSNYWEAGPCIFFKVLKTPYLTKNHWLI